MLAPRLVLHARSPRNDYRKPVVLQLPPNDGRVLLVVLRQRLDDVDALFSKNPLVKQIIDFMRSDSDRSFCVPNNVATPTR